MQEQRVMIKTIEEREREAKQKKKMMTFYVSKVNLKKGE